MTPTRRPCPSARLVSCNSMGLSQLWNPCDFVDSARCLSCVHSKSSSFFSVSQSSQLLSLFSLQLSSHPLPFVSLTFFLYLDDPSEHRVPRTQIRQMVGILSQLEK